MTARGRWLLTHGASVLKPYLSDSLLRRGILMSQITSYSLALLKLMDESYKSTGQPFLGIAKRVGVESSTFNLPAHKVLLALITHAQSPDSIAREMLVELGNCGNSLVETLGLLFR
jgi:hypothetical protein